MASPPDLSQMHGRQTDSRVRGVGLVHRPKRALAQLPARNGHVKSRRARQHDGSNFLGFPNQKSTHLLQEALVLGSPGNWRFGAIDKVIAAGLYYNDL